MSDLYFYPSGQESREGAPHCARVWRKVGEEQDGPAMSKALARKSARAWGVTARFHDTRNEALRARRNAQ